MAEILDANDARAQATTVTPSYFQQKIADFQNLLYNLDAGAAALWTLYEFDDGSNPEYTAKLEAQLQAYDDKKGEFKMAAEAMNAAIGGYNALGGELPSINIPAGLGVAPLVIGVGVLAVVAGLTTFGIAWLKSSAELTRLNTNYAAISDPEKRSTAAAAQLQIEGAAREAEGGTMSQVASIAKWIAIAALGYFALQQFGKR